MLDKVRALVCSTPVNAGQNVFDELDLFSRAASQEEARRSKRQTSYTLEELLSMVDKDQAGRRRALHLNKKEKTPGRLVMLTVLYLRALI